MHVCISLVTDLGGTEAPQGAGDSAAGVGGAEVVVTPPPCVQAPVAATPAPATACAAACTLASGVESLLFGSSAGDQPPTLSLRK